MMNPIIRNNLEKLAKRANDKMMSFQTVTTHLLDWHNGFFLLDSFVPAEIGEKYQAIYFDANGNNLEVYFREIDNGKLIFESMEIIEKS